MTAANVMPVPDRIWEVPAVWRFTAPNPGPKTLSGTHTYLIGHRDACIIDPGPDIDAYQQALADWVVRHKQQCGAILLTHGHPDHAPGAERLSQLLRAPIRAAENLDTSYFARAPVFEALHEGEKIGTGSDALVALVTPGHSRDHLAFFLESARIVFVGDTILGYGSSLVAPPEGNMADYMRTLARLRSLNATLIAPGHGPLISDPSAKIDQYIEHRQERERQIVAALVAESLSVAELVERLYVGIEAELQPLAAASVTAQLEKLMADGRVRISGNRYARAKSE